MGRMKELAILEAEMHNNLYISTDDNQGWGVTVNDMNAALQRSEHIKGMVYKLTEQDMTDAPYVHVIKKYTRESGGTNKSITGGMTISVNADGDLVYHPDFMNTGHGYNADHYITTTPGTIGIANTPTFTSSYSISTNTRSLDQVLKKMSDITQYWKFKDAFTHSLGTYCVFTLFKDILAIDGNDGGNYALFDKPLIRMSYLFDYGIIPSLDDATNKITTSEKIRMPTADLYVVGYTYRSGTLTLIALDFRTNRLYFDSVVVPRDFDPDRPYELDTVEKLLRYFHKYINERAHIVKEIPVERIVYI